MTYKLYNWLANLVFRKHAGKWVFHWTGLKREMREQLIFGNISFLGIINAYIGL